MTETMVIVVSITGGPRVHGVARQLSCYIVDAAAIPADFDGCDIHVAGPIQVTRNEEAEREEG